MLSLPYNIVLGSQSPRRSEILRMAGFTFRIHHIDYDEKIEGHFDEITHIPVHLAEQKALHATGLEAEDLLITADTLVFLDNTVLGKPADLDHAYRMVESLSGRTHEVVTGVCIKYDDRMHLFSDTAKVTFKELDAEEIEYYITHYPVLDKAGSYGVQDWMGLVGIERMEGSYFNVMGLPIHMLYEELKAIENEKR